MNKAILRKVKSYIFLFRLNKPFLAVPFTITTAFLVSNDQPDTKKLIGIIIAVIGGFMSGNAFNAITDRNIDKLNPRTDSRPLTTNDLSVKEAAIALLFSVMAVIIGTAIINLWYILLLPIPLALCFGYSLSKRFTWLCHLILGVTNAICPVSSWGVFSGWFEVGQLLIGSIVVFWTMGFELLYSSQDVEFDKKSNMKSIPVTFGLKFTFKLSVICHIIMYVMIALLMYQLQTGLCFAIGVILSVPLIVTEHMLVKGEKLMHPKIAFDLNQLFSLTLMLFAIIDNGL